MKRITIISTVLALLLSLPATKSVSAQSTMRRTADNLEVDIWTDKDDGSNYYEGDNVTIYFRASEDAYVVVYDLDTRGNVNLLFPEDPSDNNYVEGGQVYMIPSPDADYELTLEGPPGDENLQVIASRDYFPLPDWGNPVNVKDKDFWGFDYEGDNTQFISQVNFKYFPQNSAFDHVSFYVAPRDYYEADNSDCYGDCGQVYVDYPNGCEVYVDGVFYGYAPLYVPHAYLGRHRLTVYWGTSIVYNDWILVNAWDPFFVYPRPLWIYDYCWNNWYRDYHWGYYDYYGGRGRDRGHFPSQTKYKDGRNFYTYHKPEPKRGYKIISNTHSGYGKSKAYTEARTKRITNFKTEYGYNKTTKIYTKSNPYGKGKTGYKPGTVKTTNRGIVGGKTTPRGTVGKKTYNTKNRGVYQKGSTPSRGSKGSYKGGSKSSGGKKGGSYNGGSKSSGSSPKGKGSVKSGGEKKSGSSKSSGGSFKKGSSGKSGGSKSSGSKSAPRSKGKGKK